MRKVPAAAVLLVLLLALPAVAGRPLSLRRGRPLESGLGKAVVLTNLPARSKEGKAIAEHARHREATILRFSRDKVASVRRSLMKIGPEFVLVAVRPTTVDMNFHLEMLELCRGLDADPMPDFHFGYLCAANGEDLAAFTKRIRDREASEDASRVAKVVALTGDGKHLVGLDYLLHFGHGQPWKVVGGMTGKAVGRLSLPRGPVVWSGACFGGVLSRSYHKSTMQMVHLEPTTIEPEHLLSLNWVHAGATGYFAALEADRGEMAMAEWDYFRERACTLGEVMSYQYRLAFTSLPADFEGFVRFTPGGRKDKSFYGVMLNGMISRLLLSDPMYRPLREPLDEPATAVRVEHDAEAGKLRVTIEVLRWSQGQMLNYLPARSDRFDRRVYRRVPLPDGVERTAGPPTVSAITKGAAREVSRHHVRHEVWGGKRWLNLQVESKQGIGAAGTRVVFEFPVKR
jgi:hypothetical protein